MDGVHYKLIFGKQLFLRKKKTIEYILYNLYVSFCFVRGDNGAT